MIKNILCAVDRSPSSLQAFSYAIAFARWRGARLILLEVIEAAASARRARVPLRDSAGPETRAALERDLRRVLAARRASDLNVTILLREGAVVQEILAQAEASRADLVVMGSHGHRHVQRLVRLGSVAEKVLRLAACPVLTVRSGTSVALRSRSLFRTILCATDFSAEANGGVAYARRLAKEVNAKLIVMHAVELPRGGATSGGFGGLRQGTESSARDELVRLLPRPRGDARVPEAVVTFGKASAAIVKVARERSVDLIVLGVSGRGAVETAGLGSTTHRVIRDGTWPVLTVRTVTR